MGGHHAKSNLSWESASFTLQSLSLNQSTVVADGYALLRISQEEKMRKPKEALEETAKLPVTQDEIAEAWITQNAG